MLLNLLSFVLVIVGALNWGLTGVLNFNLVETLFGHSMIAKLVYGLVALGGLYLLFGIISNQGQLKVYE